MANFVATSVPQQPILAPKIDAMGGTYAVDHGVAVDQVNVNATTNQPLCFNRTELGNCLKWVAFVFVRN
ncbi:2-C-methyl-D-erythritol 2,4-cyclodiphosphate synthase, partial [Pseudomonas aeruginosa]